MKYRFFDFILYSNIRQLKYKNNPVYLTKKCYDLLVFFLNNSNESISREELIDHVWNGRIVSDNTIDQCISKLRKILNNEYPAEYIKSVYAQGVRFLPEVIKVNVVQRNDRSSINTFKNRYWITAFISVFLLVSIFYFYNHYTSSTTISKQAKRLTPLPISVVSLQPSSTESNNDNQWFVDGGSVYLKSFLSKSNFIKLVVPDKFLSKDENTQRSVINLLNKKKIELAVMNDFSYDGEFYMAKITVRNQDGIVAENIFKAIKISPLMLQVSNWVMDTVGLTKQNLDLVLENQDLSKNEFALQSYMHAMSAQLKGDSKKAIVFLESSIEQDPEFYQAWYELAIAFRKQGNYKKSLSILNAIDHPSNNLAYKVEMVKGHVLDSMYKFPQALEAYQKSYKIAKTLGNNDKISAIQVSRAITYIKLKDYVKSRELLDAALQFTHPESQAQFYGVIMNNYAKLEKAQQNYYEASEYTTKAIDAFILSGNKRSEMLAKTRLSSLLLHLGLLDEAEELAKESLIYAKQNNQLRSISSNHFKLGLIYHAIGKFKDSKNHWLSALKINKALDLPLEKAAIFEYLIMLFIDFHDTENTQMYLKRLGDLAIGQPLEGIDDILMRSQLKYALASKNSKSAQHILSGYKGKVTSEMSLLYGDLSRLQAHWLAAENHYVRAIQGFSKTSDNLKIIQAMNRLNQLYLIDNIDIEKAKKNINSMEQYNPFAYPYFKYKAILNFKQGNKIKAISLLQELKLKANDYWQAEDQLLLEHYQKL